jgi:hypothetical protein
MDPRTFGSETSVSYRCEHSDPRVCSSTTALCRSLLAAEHGSNACVSLSVAEMDYIFYCTSTHS